jgi:hypothetical protein
LVQSQVPELELRVKIAENELAKRSKGKTFTHLIWGESMTTNDKDQPEYSLLLEWPYTRQYKVIPRDTGWAWEYYERDSETIPWQKIDHREGFSNQRTARLDAETHYITVVDGQPIGDYIPF